MKRVLVIILLIASAVSHISAQNVEVGAYAPPIGNVEWISDKPELSPEKFLLIEFFHSANSDCRKEIEECNERARIYRDTMDVIVLTREPSEQVAGMLLHQYQYFYVATDESGETFRSFGTNHVPYALIVNPKGAIVWAGNPVRLTTTTIDKILRL